MTAAFLLTPTKDISKCVLRPKESSLMTFRCGKVPDRPESSILSSLSTNDRAEFLRLTADQIHAWTLAKVEEYKKTIVTLCFLHNTASSPILRLPSEMLMAILGQCVETSCVSYLHLSQVCRQWRETALATPDLWANCLRTESIVSPHRGRVLSQELLEMLLSRSAPSPIDMPTYNFENVDVPWQLLEPHWSRMRTIRCSLWSLQDVERLLNILSAGAPFLRDINLLIRNIDDAGREVAEGNLVRWDSESFPRLSSMLIYSGYLTSTITVPTLHTLDFSHYSSTRIDDKLLDALERCSHTLRILRLSRPPQTWTPHTAVITVNRVVHFPNLLILWHPEKRFERSRAFVHLSFDRRTTMIGLGQIMDTANFTVPAHYTPPHCDRVHIGYGETPSRSNAFQLSIRCFSGAVELVCMDSFPLFRGSLPQGFLQTFVPHAVTTLVVNNHLENDFIVESLLAPLWSLQSLELMPDLPLIVKRQFANGFLRVQGTSYRHLSIVWVLYGHPGGTYRYSLVKDEMSAIEDVLQDWHCARLKANAGRASSRLTLQLRIVTDERLHRTPADAPGQKVYSRPGDYAVDVGSSRNVADDYVPRLRRAFAGIVVVDYEEKEDGPFDR